MDTTIFLPSGLGTCQRMSSKSGYLKYCMIMFVIWCKWPNKVYSLVGLRMLSTKNLYCNGIVHYNHYNPYHPCHDELGMGRNTTPNGLILIHVLKIWDNPNDILLRITKRNIYPNSAITQSKQL